MTLQQIAEQRRLMRSTPAKLADLLVAEMKAGGGFITKDDLCGLPGQGTQADPRHLSRLRHLRPAAAQFRRHHPGRDAEYPGELRSAENRALVRPSRCTCMAEAMRAAYCRSRPLSWRSGLRPASPISSRRRTTRQSWRRRSTSRRRRRAKRSRKDIPLSEEGDSTTHFSIIDADGMAVANTYTLEDSYGSRVVVRGAGFLLNNEMGDFNSRPGVTTAKGSNRHRAQPDRPGQADAQLADADDRREGRQAIPDHRQPRQPDHYQHRLVHGGQCDRLRHGHSVGGRRPAAASPMVSRTNWSLEGRDAELIEKLESLGHKVQDAETRRRPFDFGRSEVGRLLRRRRPTDQRQGGGVLRACTVVNEDVENRGRIIG